MNKMLALPISISKKMEFWAFVGIIVMVSHFPISSGEPVSFTTCGDTNSGAKDSCEIKNMVIQPCPEAEDNDTCSAIRGSNMSIQFDWVPPFTSHNFTSAIYSSILLVDIPDIDHDKPGCQYSQCPVVAGKKQTFKSTRYVRPQYPAGSYLVKYKLWHEEGGKECCFLLNVNIV